jgi:hypothetical protein
VTATRTSELLIVQIIPANHAELPTTSSEIHKRLNQITFNSSLQRDLEASSMMSQLCREGDMQNSRLGRKLRRLKLHRLVAEDHVAALSGHSFMNTEWEHLQHLRDQRAGPPPMHGWRASQHLGWRTHHLTADRLTLSIPSRPSARTGASMIGLWIVPAAFFPSVFWLTPVR